ncbi:MAG: carbohydrate binding family 9 domain-containing protein [Sphingobacteriales bacterium]|nr:carbohydrate binding family 9 domain-containing protein [Sphingobacteriales bacterium]
MRKQFLFTTVSGILIGFCVSAQEIDVSKYKEQYQLHVTKAKDKIKVDGDLDEEAWKSAETAKDFWLKFPKDDSKAFHHTEVKASYDQNFLYIGAVIYDSLPLIGQSLKRDSRIRESDGIGIVLDPMNKKTNGFYFSVTAYNVQADDLLTAGQEGDITFSWDNKWYSKTKIFDDHYVIEVAIPFKTLRYDKASTRWGINFIRSERKKNEFHTWTRVPVNFPGPDLGYTGVLIWDVPPPAPGTNISIIPYITGGLKESKIDNEELSGDFNAGFDAKIALNSSLNLDLTVNPDFSQVEVDRQVTNITRFSIFFPERRNFFLENSDLFSGYGIPPIRPFYSRRIGLDNDGNTISIIGGARLTGNIAPKTRVGLMTMQTKAKGDFASQNYSAVSINQQVLRRSLFKAYFLNRTGIETTKHPIKDPMDKYGRNAGAEFSFTNEKGDVQAWSGFHSSMKKDIHDKNAYLNLGAGYFGRQFFSFINYDNLGTNYYTDMGFVQRIENYDAARDTVIRLGYKSFYSESQYKILPEKGNLNQIEFNLESSLILNPDNSFNEFSVGPGFAFDSRNTSTIDFGMEYNRTKLLFPSSFTDGDPLPPGLYNYTQGWIRLRSDNRKKISAVGGGRIGGFYNGSIIQLSTSLIYRNQPKLVIDLNCEYNHLNFPAPYGNENLFLLSTRIEYSFSNSMFWTTFIQYNTQANNININSRFQWRYKPASDFFLVYTDNYYSDPLFKNKSRAIVFKLNYWLNL